MTRRFRSSSLTAEVDLWSIRPAAIADASDPRDLGVYLWNEQDAKDGYRVNLGCVEGIDPLALEISIIDGKALPVIEGGQ